MTAGGPQTRGPDDDLREGLFSGTRTGVVGLTVNSLVAIPGLIGDSLRRPRIGLVGLGAWEQHGPHLPMDTDTRIAEYFVNAVAQQFDVVRFPTLQVGMSAEHSWFPGTSTLSSMEFRKRVLDAVVVMRDSGATAVIFVNCHGGNRPTVEQVCDDLSHGGLQAMCVQPITMVASRFVGGPMPDVHAGLLETSVIASIAPELVNWAAAAALDIGRLDARQMIRRLGQRGVYWPWRSDDPTIAAEGVVGDPQGASAELGARIVAEATRELIQSIELFERVASNAG